MESLVSWKGRRVLITGHTGFKGSWLTLWLASKGAKVYGFALKPPTEPNMFEAAKVQTVLADEERGNLLDYGKLRDRMFGFNPEIIFHLAAQPIVRKAYDDPLATYCINSLGTAHVLEAARKCINLKGIICITTDKVYDNKDTWSPYTESDKLGGHDPYSASKACAELIIQSYRKSYGLNVASVRAGNVIGGGDWAQDRLIPDLIRGFQSKTPVSIRNPKAVRPWQHVLDPLHGYILLAEKMLSGEAEYDTAFNFGPHLTDSWEVGKVADYLVKVWGSEAEWNHKETTSVHEDKVLLLDSTKARLSLRWKPKLRIDASLEWVSRWYRRHENGVDMKAFTLEQIQKFDLL